MEEKVGPSKQEEVINSFRLGSLLLRSSSPAFFKKLAKCAEWGLGYFMRKVVWKSLLLWGWLWAISNGKKRGKRRTGRRIFILGRIEGTQN